MKYWLFVIWAAMAVVFTSCFGGKRDRVLAQVGEEKLMLSTLVAQLPIDVSPEDSAAFVNEAVERWVADEVLYYQGKRHLDNYNELVAQAEAYKHNLIGQVYETRLLQQKRNEVSDEECQSFYDEYKQQLLLDRPVIQGLYVKLPKPANMKMKAMVDLRSWLKQLLAGNTDHAEELEQYCQLHAVEYETWLEEWVELSQLSSHLPVVVADAATFLKQQVYEMTDDDFVYLFIISDFRLSGEPMPFDYALPQVRDILLRRNYRQVKQQLMNELIDDMKRSGVVK